VLIKDIAQPATMLGIAILSIVTLVIVVSLIG
jgi:hypothetical protein